MGDLRFTVPNIQDFDPRVWDTAYITGIEGIPWKCHHSVGGQQFSIGRQIDESGKLNLVWPSDCMGNVCLTTTSLRVRDEPYCLTAEVARGTVNRLKSQTYEWQRVGLKPPETFFPLAEDSLQQLLKSLTLGKNADAQHEHAQRSINLALQASVQLCDAFSLQSLDARRNNEGRLSTLLGARLQSELSLESVGESLQAAFNLACITADFGKVESSSGGQAFSQFDQQVAWASQCNQKICIGPVVDFREGRLPQWMVLLNEGFESILDAACKHAHACVERYRGRAHLWNCAAGLNVPSDLGWTDEEILRMAVSLIETVRRADDRSPVLLTIDQPWSEYLRDDAHGISPLHFADALIRADLGLSGLALELNFDSWPGGTFPRDLLEISRLIDRWSMLGLPLMVVLSCPSDVEPEHDGAGRISDWQSSPAAGQLAPEAIVRILMAKPSVHAIIWNSLSDQVAGSQGTGLWNSSGRAKPLLANIAKLRKTYLH